MKILGPRDPSRSQEPTGNSEGSAQKKTKGQKSHASVRESSHFIASEDGSERTGEPLHAGDISPVPSLGHPNLIIPAPGQRYPISTFLRGKNYHAEIAFTPDAADWLKEEKLALDLSTGLYHPLVPENSIHAALFGEVSSESIETACSFQPQWCGDMDRLAWAFKVCPGLLAVEGHC